MPIFRQQKIVQNIENDRGVPPMHGPQHTNALPDCRVVVGKSIYLPVEPDSRLKINRKCSNLLVVQEVPQEIADNNRLVRPRKKKMCEKIHGTKLRNGISTLTTRGFINSTSTIELANFTI